MKKIVGILRKADLYGRKGIVLLIFQIVLCWAVCKDIKNTVPVQYAIMCCISGSIFGLFLVIKIAVPFSRYLDSKTVKLHS